LAKKFAAGKKNIQTMAIDRLSPANTATLQKHVGLNFGLQFSGLWRRNAAGYKSDSGRTGELIAEPMKKTRIFQLALNLLIILLAATAARGGITGITFTALGEFSITNGLHPFDHPVLAADGNLYGTAVEGGINGANGVGVIFKVTTNAQLTVAHYFSTNVSDGAYPYAPLIVGQDGNFYGVTSGGGSNNLGTIFEFTTNGTYTQLYSFGMETNDLDYALDGSAPYASLVQGRDGNFYGVTYQGGTIDKGTVFQFSTNGTLTTLHSFDGNGTNDDGAYPYLAPLVEGADGVFYGTTAEGGTNNYGMVFQITADGIFTNLFEFDGTNGAYPCDGLNFGTNGNLYGTTYSGGTNFDGTIFETTTNGILTNLVQFNGTNGLFLYGGVFVDTNNNIYGTTYQGGATGYGTVFQLTANGQLTTLYSFTDGNDGSIPYSGVTRDAGGNLYGTTFQAGSHGSGTVFRLRDTAIPTLTITSPTANQRWSNDVFTATGTAKDNVNVEGVFCELNGSGWSNAVTANNWSNWTAQVTLTPGTNLLKAYAVDGAGNISTTSTVSFVYVVSAPLTVLTNGLGTVSPNYNGALLQIGVNYSMTAAAASGFGFVNWTDENGNPLTNSTTLKFLMESNLTFTANFVDVTKPTLTVTSPTAGQRWSNEVFTVTGTAKDNVSVSNVFYSLNSSGWSNAATANHWSNWTAQVTLTPGTNLLQAYSVDGAGNTSTSNSVAFDFVVTNQLQVIASGLGTISPDYSNAWLEVGRNYNMTATPASGFVVTNWVIATNQLSGRVTNNATVQFMMESNLILQVNFAEVTKPTLTIASPVAGQHMTNALATFAGTAKDNWGCSGVWYQLNNGRWSLAATGNGYTNWSATNTLVIGTNLFKAYAIDFGGNFSTTNSLSVLSSNTFELQLAFSAAQPLSGNGLTFNLEISPGLSGHIQASTNLLDWITLTNFVGTGTNLLFNDQTATNYDSRFYRAVIP
jgi:uncharacterized repeat protein (TIGR03803 family)